MDTSVYHNRLKKWIRRQLSQFQKKSWQIHTSIEVADLYRAIEFYEKLGFNTITTSKGEEVTLLRSPSGTELNLVCKKNAKASKFNIRSSAALAVPNLDKTIAGFHKSGIKISSGPVTGANSRWMVIKDPDLNSIEFYQTLTNLDHSERTLFHIATKDELTTGISEFYYSPPDDEKRFLYCEVGSTLVLLTAANIHKRLALNLILVRLSITKVSLMPSINLDYEMDLEKQANDISSYPDVYAPIAKDAISGAAPLTFDGDSFQWPERFDSLDLVLA